ncbi:MAG TPA: hypothetical protein VMF14_04380 [Solirubrobacteraceae bacterium]|nr:hypothetical protein [Solirubrobacteraceae bacterium]
MGVQRVRWAGALLVIVAALALPASAAAHGPIDPPASSYLALVTTVPTGVSVRTIDGDQRLWMRVAPRSTVVVLDYQGAPYLRFSRSGVEVNEASAMYYLNQVPAQIPPLHTGPSVAPHWSHVSSGHTYEWHDGRLHALATTALPAGPKDLGPWQVRLRADGFPAAITGRLYYRPSPSIVWFWPILVLLACVLAARRLRRPELDERIARALTAVALAAFAVAVTGQQLHGRPFVSVGQGIVLALALAFAAWGAWRLAIRRHGWFTFFVIAAVAIWEGASLIAVLLDGYVLIALPPLVARVAVVTCLSAGVALLPVIFALAERPRRRLAGAVVAGALVALALGGCGSSSSGAATSPGQAIPAALVAQARPIGRGAAFHPPARGPITGACRAPLGRRDGVHVELFAANRVVLVAAGIGVRGPVTRSGGRITGARCYGDLVTLEPTGVVLTRPGSHLTVGGLFRAWGRPLSARRLLSFRGRVTVFVDGRPRPGSPGGVPLTRHAEIVLEVGPHVPPHPAYHFPPGT